MKLIRLESDSELTQSQFTNYLGVPLILKKNGKVALRSLSAQFKDPPFIVSDANDTFSFQTSDDFTVHTINLTHGSYTIDALCEMLQNEINCTLDGSGEGEDTDNTDYGFMWIVTNELISDGSYKITFTFDRSSNITLDDTNTGLYNVAYDTDGDDRFFKKDTTDPEDPDVLNSYFFSNYLLCNGGFSTSFIINRQDIDQTEDIIDSNWYVTIEPNKTLTGDVSFQSIVNRSYALFGCFGGLYVYVQNNIIQLSDVIPELGDTVEIFNNNGVINYKVPGNLFVGDSLSDLPDLFGTDDVMVCLYIQSDAGKIGFFDFQLTPNPYDTVDASGNHLKISASNIVLHRSRLNASASNVTMSFLPGSQRLLGFKNSSYSENGVSGSFVSDGFSQSNIFDNDFVIEVPEFDTGCYDHTYKTKRNILSVVTSGDLKNKTTGIGSDYKELSINEVFPTFISLNNFQNGLTFSSLTIRVSSQGSLIPLAGNMSCSLLFMDEEDD